MTITKRCSLITAIITAILACAFCICSNVYAEESSLQFDKNEVTLNAYSQSCETVKVLMGNAVSAEAEDPSLVECYPWFEDWQEEHYFYVEPIGNKLGSTNIVVTDDQGKTAKVKVKVEAPFKLNYSSLTVNQSYKSYYHLSNPNDVYLYGLPSYVIYSHSPVDDSGNVILREDEFDGQCPYSKVVFSNEAFGDPYGEWYIRYISKVVSKNTSVVKIRSNGYTPETWEILPVSTGTATIECTDIYGQKANLKVVVNKSYMDSYIQAKTSIGNLKYGATTVSGNTLKGSKVSAQFAGKKYTASVNSNGKYTFKLPIKKIGTAIKYTISYGGGQYTVTKKVAKPGASIAVSRIYRTTKKATVTAKNVHKGDVIVVKVGKKKYTKKIKKDAKSYKYTVKLKKKYKAGTAVTATINNKFKQKVASKSYKVYYASKVKKKMTKKQCLLVPKWTKPKYKRKDGDMDVWYYDFDGDGYDAYLLFIRGKLSEVHYY